MSFTERCCQIIAIDAISKNDKGIIRMCCGSGKTYVEVMTCLSEKISCLVAPRNALLRQHLEIFKQRVGFVDSPGDFLYSFSTNEFQIVTINCESDFSFKSLDFSKKIVLVINNSSFKKLEEYNIKPDVIVVDEAHTHKKCIKCPLVQNTKRRYFFTATPQDMNDSDFYGETIYRFDYDQALIYDYVTQIKIVPVQDGKEMMQKMKEYGLSHCIHFYETVNGSSSKNTSLQSVNMNDYYNSMKITEETTVKERIAIFEKFILEGGHLFSCKTISYGIDIKECDCVYLSYQSNSVPDTVQKFSRAIRKNPNDPNKIAYVFLQMDIYLPEPNEELDITEIMKQSRLQLILRIIAIIKEGFDLDILDDYYPHNKTKEKLEKGLSKLKEILIEKKNGECDESEIEEIEEAIKDTKTHIEQANDTGKLSLFEKFIDDFQMRILYRNGELQPELNVARLTLEEAFEELLKMKNEGKQVNGMSKETLSNGTRVDCWLIRNKKKLSEEQLKQLDLHDKTLTTEEVFGELLQMKNEGRQINSGSKEVFSNGNKVCHWIQDNRKHLSDEQLRQLELHNLTTEEVFGELLQMKNEGRQVNTQSKETLSNGIQVGPWLRDNRKKLSDEQLKLLGLYNLTLEKAFQELLQMKNEGRQINRGSKEVFSNGTQVCHWMGGNRKKLSDEQLRQLDLHDKTLTTEEVFGELLQMKNEGIKINTTSKEKLSNGTRVGCWLIRNRKNLSNEQLKQLELYNLTLEEAFGELLQMKNEGRQVNTQSKETLSNGIQVGPWLNHNRKKLSDEQLELLDLHDKTLTLKEAFGELLQMKNEGRQINQGSKEVFSNGNKVCHWMGDNRKKLSDEQLKLLGLKTKKMINISAEIPQEEPIIKLQKETLNPNISDMSPEQKDALLLKLLEQNNREYRAPNPIEKDEINNKFSESLIKSEGLIIVLDTLEFNTAKSLVEKGFSTSDIIIPQYDQQEFEKMKKDITFGKCVILQDLESLLVKYSKTQTLIKGIYADLMCALTKGKNVVKLISKCNLINGCVIGITISSRDGNRQAEYTNSFVSKINSCIYENIKECTKLEEYVYGNGNTMATVLFRKNN